MKLHKRGPWARLLRVTGSYLPRRYRKLALFALMLFCVFFGVTKYAFPTAPTVLSQIEITEVPELDMETTDVDWSKFAYTLYATDTVYLCNAVMLFESLHRLGAKADRVLLYPRSLEGSSLEWENTIKARDHYGVKLQPIDLITKKVLDCK